MPTTLSNPLLMCVFVEKMNKDSDTVVVYRQLKTTGFGHRKKEHFSISIGMQLPSGPTASLRSSHRDPHGLHITYIQGVS